MSGFLAFVLPRPTCMRRLLVNRARTQRCREEPRRDCRWGRASGSSFSLVYSRHGSRTDAPCYPLCKFQTKLRARRLEPPRYNDTRHARYTPSSSSVEPPGCTRTRAGSPCAPILVVTTSVTTEITLSAGFAIVLPCRCMSRRSFSVSNSRSTSSNRSRNSRRCRIASTCRL